MSDKPTYANAELMFDELITKNAKLIYANDVAVREVRRLDSENARLRADLARLGTQNLQNQIMVLESTLQQIRDLVMDE